MQDSRAIQDWVKDQANTIVLGLLFVSLLVIYLVVFPSFQVTVLSVIILSIGLFIAVNGRWNDLFVLAVFAAFVSLVAAYFYGQMRFGRVGGVLLTILWGVVLLLLSQRVARGIRRVPVNPESPAILIGRGSDRRPYVAAGPYVIPFLQPIVAVIPRKILIEEFNVDDINAEPGHNVDRIAVHVRYRIVDPAEAFMHTSQMTLNEAARQMGKSLEEARLDVTFWENLFENHLLKIDAAKAVREVAFQQSAGAHILYKNRAALADQIIERLNALVDTWGAVIEVVELDYFKVDGERFRNADPERRRTIEFMEAAHQAGMEAERLKRVLASEVEAEALRVRAIIEALRQSEVEITPDVVIRAIRAASDWVMEGDYTLQPTSSPSSLPMPPSRPPSDKK
jgi:hypothetical protein